MIDLSSGLASQCYFTVWRLIFCTLFGVGLIILGHIILWFERGLVFRASSCKTWYGRGGIRGCRCIAATLPLGSVDFGGLLAEFGLGEGKNWKRYLFVWNNRLEASNSVFDREFTSKVGYTCWGKIFTAWGALLIAFWIWRVDRGFVVIGENFTEAWFTGRTLAFWISYTCPQWLVTYRSERVWSNSLWLLSYWVWRFSAFRDLFGEERFHLGIL